MLSFHRTHNLTLAVLMLGLSPLAGCGAGSGAPGHKGDAEEADIASAERALTGSLPGIFTATIQTPSATGPPTSA